MQICTWDGRCAAATGLLWLVVPGAVSVDSPQYGQQYMLLCRHRLFSPNFSLLKGCINEFAQCVQDKRVVSGEKKLKCASWFYFTNVVIFCWYFGKHSITFPYRWDKSAVHLQRHYRMDIVVQLWVFWAWYTFPALFLIRGSLLGACLLRFYTWTP